MDADCTTVVAGAGGGSDARPAEDEAEPGRFAFKDKCLICGEKGHRARDCPQKKIKDDVEDDE